MSLADRSLICSVLTRDVSSRASFSSSSRLVILAWNSSMRAKLSSILGTKEQRLFPGAPPYLTQLSTDWSDTSWDRITSAPDFRFGSDFNVAIIRWAPSSISLMKMREKERKRERERERKRIINEFGLEVEQESYRSVSLSRRAFSSWVCAFWDSSCSRAILFSKRIRVCVISERWAFSSFDNLQHIPVSFSYLLPCRARSSSPPSKDYAGLLSPSSMIILAV